MEFVTARPDVVRAINQRWLIKLWQRHRLGHRVPPWQGVMADSLKAMSDNLSLLDVDGTGDDIRFAVRFHGQSVAKAYGTGDHRGKFLHEIMPPALRGGVKPYVRAASGGCPIYTIHDLKDRDGHLVHCERLLLPFAADGQTVDRILASLEFVSPDGAFDERDLLRVQMTPPPVRLAVQLAAAP